MSSMYISQIQMWACNFAPRGWAACNGQLMAISQNTALFALIGTYYGGNGTTNFNLPDFRGRMPMGFGQVAGLTPRGFAQAGGAENVTLQISNMPAHNHAPVLQATTASGTGASPGAGALLANIPPVSGTQNVKAYTNTPGALVNMGGLSESNVGGGSPVNIVNPYLAIGFTIAIQGLFPARS